MLDYLLTALIPFVLGFTALWGNKKNEECSNFMSKDYTCVLKACCCIIVIMVHIPIDVGNKLQDAIGSFAYVAVTFFFLFSAYGMNLSVNRKSNYLDDFWRNRLSALLIPCMIINISKYIFDIVFVHEENIITLLQLNGYVIVLLQYCLLFWIVQKGRKLYSENTANIILIVCVIISSLILYFLTFKEISAESGWCFERVGLVWGILLLSKFSIIKRWLSPNPMKISILLFSCVILGILYLNFKHVYFWGEYFLKIILGIVIIAFVLQLGYKRRIGNKAILFLGDISYEVYLVHGIIIGILHVTFRNMDSGLFVLLTVSITVFFSAIIHKIDKPLVKWCRA